MGRTTRTADYSHLGGDEIRAPTLVDTVAERLRASILSGQLAPGERLYEAALAREFGISRGPIREALALLEGDGLVVNEPRRGKFVREIDARIIDEIYSLRRVLEPYAAELVIESMSDNSERVLRAGVAFIEESAATGDLVAIARSDLAFHRTMYELTDHRPLERAWHELIAGSLQMLVNITTPTHALGDPVRNHEQIVDSLVASDIAATQQLVIDHVEDAWKRANAAVIDLQPRETADQ